MIRFPARWPIWLVTGGLVLSACSGTAAEQPDANFTARPGPATPRLRHIAIIVLENKEYADVMESSEAPYLNSLADEYSQADRMFAITHPSLPNYLAMISGGTQGIETNCHDCLVMAPNLVDQMAEADITWKAYMEGMASPCSRVEENGYVVRHNPFLYFDSITGDAVRCRNIVPFVELERAMRSKRLPGFIFITPNTCNDAHDCPLDTADGFLADVVPDLIAAMGKRSVVIVTFDEGGTEEGCCGVAAGGHIATVVAGSGAVQGGRTNEPLTNYSILRTVEESFDLPLLGEAACPCTGTLSTLLRRH